MSLLAWLPLAATTLFSEKIPTLSEPRMIQISAGTTLWADGDSVNVGSLGLIQGYCRTGDQIKLQREIKSALWKSSTPNIGLNGVLTDGDSLLRCFPTASYTGPNIVLDYTLNYLPGAPIQIRQGYPAYFTGSNGFYDTSNWVGQSTYYRMICGDNQIKSGFPGNWQTLDIPINGHPVCNLVSWTETPTSGPWKKYWLYKTKAVVSWPLASGYWAVRADSIPFIASGINYDSLRVNRLNWIVSDSTGAWLTFDQSQAKLFWRKGNPHGGFAVDSLKIPGITTDQRACYQVTRRDSLVVFSVDSQIIFVKWTPSEVKVLNKYAIPGKVILAADLPDTAYFPGKLTSDPWIKGIHYLWATTATELYSFRFSWEEGSSSVLTLPRSRGLQIRTVAGGITLMKRGGGTETVRLRSLEGRQVGQIDLLPGATAVWKAPHPGVYLAETSESVQRILVR